MEPRTLLRASTGLTFCAVDACLGVPGLPQSATGQTALFTGVNAPALVGDHVTAYPTTRLREVIAEHSLLKRARESGATVAFANAHSQPFWDLVDEGKRRLGASTLTALAAGAGPPANKMATRRIARSVLVSADAAFLPDDDRAALRELYRVSLGPARSE